MRSEDVIRVRHMFRGDSPLVTLENQPYNQNVLGKSPRQQMDERSHAGDTGSRGISRLGNRKTLRPRSRIRTPELIVHGAVEKLTENTGRGQNSGRLEHQPF